jgi:hypothetical protein
MRVFWYNGALQIVPENMKETDLLRGLTCNLTVEKPPEAQACTSGGDASLGSDGLFEAVVRNEETRPSSLTRKPNNKQLVVCINKLS